jgi:hypothetical protein
MTKFILRLAINAVALYLAVLIVPGIDFRSSLVSILWLALIFGNAVVERYLGLVHTAALRQVRNAQIADDVAQVVFIILARKAGRLSARQKVTPRWAKSRHIPPRRSNTSTVAVVEMLWTP